MEDYQDKINAILNKADQIREQDPDLIYLSNGVVFRARSVPPFVLNDIQKAFKAPPIPTIPGENGIRIPNPADPEYQDKLKLNEEEYGTAITEALVGLGTILVSVPDSVPPLDDDEWLESAEYFVKHEIPRRGKPRYLAWVKYILIDSNEDLERIAKRVSAKMGVPEVAVESAMNRFRNNEERQADPGA